MDPRKIETILDECRTFPPPSSVREKAHISSIEDYRTMEWGPQPVRALYFAQHPGLSLGIRGDSDIKSFKDLKGKRVALIKGSQLEFCLDRFMIRHGLTLKYIEILNLFPLANPILRPWVQSVTGVAASMVSVLLCIIRTALEIFHFSLAAFFIEY